MTLRKELKEQRKRDILMKSLELFVTKGYAETKIGDIAESAGMSVGLLFHYFDSKEKLYEELVRLGVEGTKSPQKQEYSDAISYFENFLNNLFQYVKTQPWVFQMFVLMGQARKVGTPDSVRQLALSVNQIEVSANIIKKGQEEGCIREGNPIALATAFWCSVQGIMEQMAMDNTIPFPETEWLIDIIRA